MLIKIWRLSSILYKYKIPVVPHLIYIFNRIIFSTVIPPSAKIGRSVVLGYQGLGIVIHKRASIGNYVNIGTNTTIGGRSDFWGVPIILDNVIIGSGAKLLGPIVVGEGAKIGANAVVLTDVPPYATAVGVPAKIIIHDTPSNRPDLTGDH